MANTFKNAKVVSVTNTGDILYTAPAATQSIVHALYIGNTDGANADTVTVEMIDATDATAVILGKDLPVPAGGTMIFDKQINLEAGDQLKVTAANNNRLSAFASVLEIA